MVKFNLQIVKFANCKERFPDTFRQKRSRSELFFRLLAVTVGSKSVVALHEGTVEGRRR